jgi:hypothetical protein
MCKDYLQHNLTVMRNPNVILVFFVVRAVKFVIDDTSRNLIKAIYLTKRLTQRIIVIMVTFTIKTPIRP